MSRNLYDKIMNDYHKEDVELSGMFFDFDAEELGYNLTLLELLGTYVKLQYDINGDYVVRVDGIVKNNENVVSGETIEFLNNGKLDEIIKGNLREHLERLGKDNVFRFEELKIKDGKIIYGKLLDFVL